MKTENALLMKQARESLRGKWGLAIGTFFIYMAIITAVQAIPKAGILFHLLISGPMTLGIVMFSLSLSRNRNPKLEQIFEGFKYFTNTLIANVLVCLFIVLWALLFIIPGIIASLSYAMTFFILADDPSIGARDAIKRSKHMMNGYKWKLFCLYIRFLGWALLCILTLGIGFLWLFPYVQISITKFYEDIKNGGVSPVTV